jgi:hypothetical protein
LGNDCGALWAITTISSGAMFETVYTLADWYDGPRRGIADYGGRPFVFESEWRDGEDLDADTFLLMSIDAETFLMALEDWAIWRRWEAEFYRDNVTLVTHPALPADRNRHEELAPLLESRLIVDPAKALRKKAEFRVRHDPEWNGYGLRPLEVQWRDLS